MMPILLENRWQRWFLILLISVAFVQSVEADEPIESTQVQSDPALTGLKLRNISVDSEGVVVVFLGVEVSPGSKSHGVKASDLTISVDGQTLKTGTSVKSFAASGEGMSTLLAVDTSGTMRKAMPALKEGLASYAKELRPGLDATALGTIGNDWVLTQDFTTSPDTVASKLRGLQATAKTTALFESIDLGLQSLSAASNALPSRRFMVVVSDGFNEKLGRSANECISRAQKLGLQVHSLVYLTNKSERYLSAKGELEKISRDSGGLTVTIDKPEELGHALELLRASVLSEAVVRIDSRAAGLSAGPHRLTVDYGEYSAQAQWTGPALPQPIAEKTVPATGKEEDKSQLFLLGGIGGLFLLLLLFFLFNRRKSRDSMVDELAGQTEVSPRHSGRVRGFRVLSGLDGQGFLVLPRGAGSIGFDTGNDVVLPSESVSTHHASLVPMEGGGIGLKDEGSTNGTYIDEEKLGAEPRLIKPGSRLRFGLVVVECEE